MSKVCASCKQLLSLDLFYSDRSKKDGKGSTCKTCDNARSKRWRLTHAERQLANRRNWRKTEHAKKLMYEQQLRRRARDPLKTAAYRAIHNGLRDGKVFKKPCEVCGDIKVHAHHPDYSKPLQVQWLCEKHHLHMHRKEKRC